MMDIQIPPFIIYVLGPPASGKGTLCKLLAAERGLYHLSVGDHLRHLANTRFAHDLDFVATVKAGGTKGLLPANIISEIVIETIGDGLSEVPIVSAFLIDGLPRDLETNGEFKKMMNSKFKVNIPDLVISVTCPRDIARQRYLCRKRGDDDEDLFEKRYDLFEKRDVEVLARYREHLVEVDNSEARPEDAYEKLVKALDGNPAWLRLQSSWRGNVC